MSYATSMPNAVNSRLTGVAIQLPLLLRPIERRRYCLTRRSSARPKPSIGADAQTLALCTYALSVEKRRKKEEHMNQRVYDLHLKYTCILSNSMMSTDKSALAHHRR